MLSDFEHVKDSNKSEDEQNMKMDVSSAAEVVLVFQEAIAVYLVAIAVQLKGNIADEATSCFTFRIKA